MNNQLITAILLSISPFGESKVGIPYGVVNQLNIYVVLILCLLANILVFPIMMFFLEYVNKHLLKWHWYKKSAVFIAQRAKKGTADKIKKYGFWGLIVFVMIPLPGTGVYAGSIASYIFKIEKKRAFLANSIGISLSAIIVWATTVMTSSAF